MFNGSVARERIESGKSAQSYDPNLGKIPHSSSNAVMVNRSYWKGSGVEYWRFMAANFISNIQILLYIMLP